MSHKHLPSIAALVGLAVALLLGGCAAPKYTVDDGRPVNPQLLNHIGLYGRGRTGAAPGHRPFGRAG